MFQKMQGKEGRSYGIEHIHELVDFSIVNICKNHKYLLESGNIVVSQGDGRKGLPDEAPFDVIHVGAAAAVIPDPLVEQLALGGAMVYNIYIYI